jgi:hypothetical protein
VLSCVVSKLQLEDEPLKKVGVRGLVGQIGEPNPFLGVKLASRYKEGTYTS